MFLLAFLLAASFDSQMSVSEMKRTGLAKLSAREKSNLNTWIEAHYTPKEIAATPKPTKNQPAYLDENLSSGHYIRLSDKSLWEIDPQDTPITQGWITPVEIQISQSSDTDYPYLLTNSLTGSSVRAKRVQEKK